MAWRAWALTYQLSLLLYVVAMKSVLADLRLKFAEKTWNDTFRLVRRCMVRSIPVTKAFSVRSDCSASPSSLSLSHCSAFNNIIAHSVNNWDHTKFILAWVLNEWYATIWNVVIKGITVIRLMTAGFLCYNVLQTRKLVWWRMRSLLLEHTGLCPVSTVGLSHRRLDSSLINQRADVGSAKATQTKQNRTFFPISEMFWSQFAFVIFTCRRRCCVVDSKLFLHSTNRLQRVNACDNLTLWAV